MAFDSQLKQVEEFLRSTFEDGSRLRIFLNQKGFLAQRWLDRMQQLADYPSTSPQLRSSTFRTMLRLAKKSGLHPTCLSISNVRKFGKYPIAEGGFGEVWRGFIGSSQDPVCLKIMKVYLDSNLEKLSKDYLREAILWRQLRHPNVLPFLGIYRLEDGQQVCLISPWMEDGNLVKFLRDAPPDHVDHFALARDVAAGLSYLHEMTVVHGDLKGVNVVVNKRFRACITDFGLSRVADEHGLSLTASTTRSAGTVRWQAPELLMGSNKVTKESDVYAYGCVCYEIYAGCHPFPELAKDGAVLLKVMVQKECPSRPEGAANLSDAMWTLMKSCWSSAPPSRPTAEALLGAMDVMEAGASVSPLPNWDQSVFTPVWENVEYSPLACGDEGMPESKARSSQKASLAHSATPGTGASQQAIPNRSVANLEVHDLTNPVLISLHLQPQTHLGQSYAPFIPSRGRKRKASNEDPPMIHLKPKRALDASEGALVRLPTIRGQSNSLVSTSTTVPGTLNNNTTDVDIDIANGAPQKRRSGFSGDDTALPDRLTERNPQNRMSPPAWPGYNGGHSDLPGQNPFNLNPHMMLQALYRDQLNDQQLEPESLAQNHQTQNHPLNFVDRLNSGGLVRQGGGPNSGDPTNSKMNQPGGRSRIESHLTPSGGAETVRRSPPTHTHPSDQSSQQPQLGGADTGPSSGDPQATQKASLMDGRGGRVFTLPNLQDRESAIKDTLAQTRVQMRSLEAALLTRW